MAKTDGVRKFHQITSACPCLIMRWLLLFIVPILIASFLWRDRGGNTKPVTHFPITTLIDYDAFPWLSVAEPLQFPRDHGAHDDVPLETWQIQGTLSFPDHKKIAFQYHILALTLQPQTPKRPSAWGTKRVFLTYFTLTDPSTPNFQVEHREQRQALGLSSTDGDRIIIDDWKLAFRSNQLQLVAGIRGKYLKLALLDESMIKNASIESATLRSYQLPRLIAMGRYGDVPVTGSAWMEHSWGKLPLPGGAVSLQRLQLQMIDGNLLSCLQLKRRDDASSNPVRCTVITATGKQKPLDEARLIAISHWHSPKGKVYPVSWRLEQPKLNLQIEAVMPDQVTPGPLSWWSGWVKASGKSGELGEGFMQATEVAR